MWHHLTPKPEISQVDSGLDVGPAVPLDSGLDFGPAVPHRWSAVDALAASCPPAGIALWEVLQTLRGGSHAVPVPLLAPWCAPVELRSKDGGGFGGSASAALTYFT